MKKMSFILILVFILSGCSNTTKEILDNGMITVNDYVKVSDNGTKSNIYKYNVTIKNTTSKNFSYNTQHISIYDKENNEITAINESLPKDDHILVVDELKPDQSVTGNIYFEVTKEQEIEKIVLKNTELVDISYDILNE